MPGVFGAFVVFDDGQTLELRFDRVFAVAIVIGGGGRAGGRVVAAQAREDGVPFVMIFTKTDKQSLTRTNELIKSYLAKMGETWDELPRYFITSAETGAGRDEVLDFITEVNRQVAAEAAGAE